jgi:hypothetical protein
MRACCSRKPGSNQPQHIQACHAGISNADDLDDRILFRANLSTSVQIHALLQGVPANGLCFDGLEFMPEVGFVGILGGHVEKRLSELHGVAHEGVRGDLQP